ncbi:PstS family phosphate ABC transporter substrate-binding protein [Halocatena pleomorpha]|uniref:PstS family phosphate ABC transporter substrate-binding protein n=1 Tax=Halocatena pleomorpha TaxID=1785090 RepID=A0A3P3RGK6_9EURY|nr:PstS family phosphate ABC transporter substrate-binding protein [Halocatena pleomorpha]RRJ32541.1 PstS family phosphate ABC transporter substrate-binding protein [Halocatena pleomorpha]
MAAERPVTRRRFVAGVGVAGIGAMAGCTTNPNLGNTNGGVADGSSETLSGAINIAGSSTVFPLAKAIAVAFQNNHSNVEVSLSSTGTGGGFENFFCQGKTDFNNASRSIGDGERKRCQDNGVEPLELRVATDAVTVVVNNDADWVDCMTVEELRQIWEPNGAKQWSDVRSEWPDEPINLYGAADTSGTFDYFTESIVGEEGKHRDDYQATEKDNTIIQGVSGDRYAMGYLGFAYYQSNQDAVKAVAIDDGNGCVVPSIDTAKRGDYQPLSRPLFTYVSKAALKKPQVASFARFFVEQSTNEQIVTEQVGYVPNTDKEMNQQLTKLDKAIESVQQQ